MASSSYADLRDPDEISFFGFGTSFPLTSSVMDCSLKNRLMILTSSFHSAQALTAYCGLDPSVKQSGTFKGTHNKISKRGPRLLRRALFHVASANIRTKRNKLPINPYIQTFYLNKCLSKPKMVALVSVMHKLLFIIFAVLRDQQPFTFRDPKEHAARLTA